MRIVRIVAVLGICACGTILPATAQAQISAIYFNYFGHPEPATGQLDSGYYQVEFNGGNGSAGSISRAGTVIATAPPTGSKVAALETNLLPGDVAHLTSSEGPELTWTFTGYPTVVSDRCGSMAVSGQTAPGEPVWGVASDRGFGTPSFLSQKPISNVGGSYTATFAKPLLSASLVRVQSHVLLPQLEVRSETVAQVQEPCLAVPPPPVGSMPPSSVRQCHVPNLKHSSLGRAKRLLRKAHCRLGRVASSRSKHHRRVVVSQQPRPKVVSKSGTKVSIRLA